MNTLSPKAPTGIHLNMQNIVKTYPSRDGGSAVKAVNSFNLAIEQGQFVTLLGPSGCGKTTMLRIISGFEVPDSGQIILEGKEITYQPPNKRDMALVFQSYALFPHMSVYDNIAYGPRRTSMPGSIVRERVKSAIETVGLKGLEKRKPNQLSGGQQQRVALARALIMEPSVLLFDEPLSNLDASLRVQMRSEIHRLQRRLNITALYVTHDQEEAMALSDLVVVMNQGCIEQIGSPEEIYSRPASRFVAEFIGKANFIPTRIDRMSDESVCVNVFKQAISVLANGKFRSGDQAVVVLRPEGLRLRDDNSLPKVIVEDAMYLGSSVEYLVDANGQMLTVVDVEPHTRKILPPGSVIGIDVIPETIHLLPVN